MKVTPQMITNLAPNEIFVFGSNLQGMHAGGAAKLGSKVTHMQYLLSHFLVEWKNICFPFRKSGNM